MRNCIYSALNNVSWECVNCGLPYFSSTLFDTTFFETSNSFESLTSLDPEISFTHPGATSSPNVLAPDVNQERDRHPSTCSTPRTPLACDSSQRSSKQRDDVPLKVLHLNCHSILNKNPLLFNIIDSTQADIVIGTESWLSKDIVSPSVFPDGYNIYRNDRPSTGGGVFILVSNKYTSTQPEELPVTTECEQVWVKIDIKGVAVTLIYMIYRGNRIVLDPIRVTEDTQNILDIFFPNNKTPLNRCEVISWGRGMWG